MYQRILVPLDGSSAAQLILPYIGEIASKFDAEVTLVSVSRVGAVDMDHLYRSYLEPITELVQSQLKEYGAKDTSKVHSDVLLGKPAEEILRYADESDSELIAMASRGSSGRGPWLLGNIAAKVLRATKRPVLLIRRLADREALKQKRLIRRILVPLDGSKTGEAAIPYTLALSKALGAEVVLLHVIEPVITALEAHEVSMPYPLPIIDDSQKASANNYLDSISKQLDKDVAKVSTAIASGAAAEQIIDYTETNDIDVIAMSTHGRSGIGRWVFGSITDKVLHSGDSTLLVVPATKN
ncbi:universal stress protein [Chloroflexota bacterium]